LLVALAVALVIARRRSSNAEDELRHLRLTTRAQERRISEADRTAEAAVAVGRSQATVPAEAPAADFAE